MPGRIEDYGLIGDCETVALVGRDGSIDWLCWPRFDSGACFAALLGSPDHGCWRLWAADPAAHSSRRYRDGSLVLETKFRTSEGAARVTDFMPPRGETSDLMRLVTGLEGSVAMRTDIALRFDYGRTIPWVTQLEDEAGIRAIAGADMAVLRTPVCLQGKEFRSCADFTVKAGQTIPFVLTYGPSHRPIPDAGDPELALSDTDAFWRNWSARCLPAGRWTEAVRRSAITLKALSYQPTGGIVAAATTSLPEAIGGRRNWDYRLCWLRDATVALLALLRAGYRNEAVAWRDWLLRACMGSPSQAQVIYGLAGERTLREWELPWLPGYEGSYPVRVGNAAVEQLQIDVYGELLDTFHQGRRHGISFSEVSWRLQHALLNHLEGIWRKPDQGIWEVRSEPEHFVHSKVMAWAAVDRAVRDIEAFGLDGPLEHWRALRHEIHADICARGYDRELGSFVRAYGSRELDASLLLIPAVGFLPPEDPRVLGTIAAVERELHANGFVRRYRTHRARDGLPPGEGAFIACSFWLADCYAMTGREAEAHALFEQLLGVRNDLGLLAEEYAPEAKRFLGNFPQAYSHVALINTAYTLRKRLHETRGGEPAGPDPDAAAGR